MKTDTNLTQNQAESGNLVKPVLANRLFNTKKMTQEEEIAREIVIKMQFQKDPIMFEQAKHCALFHLESMIDMLKYYGTDIGEKYSLLRLTKIKEAIRVL